MYAASNRKYHLHRFGVECTCTENQFEKMRKQFATRAQKKRRVRRSILQELDEVDY